jgi:hypothetical protein
MKKFLAMILSVLALTIGGLSFITPAANAAEVAAVTNVTHVAGVTGVIPVTGVSIVTPETSLSAAVAAPTRVSTPTWLYVSCYLAMDGATYCWRYACTFYERVVMGCYNGWYRTSIWYA